MKTTLYNCESCDLFSFHDALLKLGPMVVEQLKEGLDSRDPDAMTEAAYTMARAALHGLNEEIDDYLGEIEEAHTGECACCRRAMPMEELRPAHITPDPEREPTQIQICEECDDRIFHSLED